jgi:hypothetical protein
MVIRPALTYGSAVWWPSVRFNVRRTQLKMTPRAAMEALLGHPSLHVMVEIEAQGRIYRLMCAQHWRPKSTKFSHTKTSQDMEHKPIL